MSVNKVILLGNAGKDPQMRYPEKGMTVASFSLATNERSANGVERTEWHNIVMFGKNGEFAENISVKARSFISRENCAPARGKTSSA